MNRNHFRFAIRKFSIGAASVLLGIGLAGVLTNKVNAASTHMSGVVHVNPVANHPTWKILLWDGEGHNTGVFIKPNSDWKVFEKKNINGLEYYRLGTDRQWVQAQYVDASNAQEIGGVNKAIYTTNGEVALVDAQGNTTGATLPAGSQWKAFAKKTINGKTYYRLGTDKQWAPANGGVLDGSVADEGVVSNQGQNFYDSSSDSDSTPTKPVKPTIYKAHINYVDASNKTVKSTEISGQAGNVINLDITAPAGYDLVDGQNLPKSITVSDKLSDITVKVQPATVKDPTYNTK
ncbi:MAG: SLAP domain-containing protein [Lactobacillus sp.]|nr:SLAP domain-containing protein [Lactobacillus sp.]